MAHHRRLEPSVLIRALEREKIDWQKPVFTLDVNQVALKQPQRRHPEMRGLAPLELNYFQHESVELCVTPETSHEILQGGDVNYAGQTAYDRFQKSELFKKRPDCVRLNLSEQEANALWTGIRKILWPTVSDQGLLSRHRSDVSQLFFHTIASGTIENSAFLTMDYNFTKNAVRIKDELGVTVLNPSEAWNEYQPKYELYQPTELEIRNLWQDEQGYLKRLRKEAG